VQFVDAWRLFGPNLQTSGPAALAEVSFDATDDVDAGVTAWKQELARMAAEVGVVVTDPTARLYRGGAVLTFSSAIDVLLPMTDLCEWAATSAASIVSGKGPLPLEPQRAEIAASLAARRSPLLLALEAEAERRSVPLVWDDDGVTLGAGATSTTWTGALPRVDEVAWDSVRGIPVALVTGTNGKTTSARLLARLLKVAGHRVGMTTTDGVWVDEALVIPGDYTGPAGATTVLRRPDVDAAVLETARGGILRRGLVARHADVALLTNVSDDHLGHYGIDDLGTLARVKAVVGAVVRPSGRIVVNADDPHLMAATGSFVAPRVLFSVDPESPGLARVADGDEAWTVRDGWLVRLSGAREVRVVRSDEVPIGFGGAAPYNLANALGAAASARALGVTDDVLAEGLRGFTSSSADNPGRGNLVRVAGVDVLVDFAHNPDGIRNVLGLVARLRARAPSPPPGGRLAIVGGYAGDRSNESIRDAARAMFDAAPARVFLRDLAGYLRGRAPGEVPQRISAELEALGLARGSIETAPSEGAALRRALEWAAPGDFVVVLAHLETAAVQAVMDEWRAR
jgi:UDP-N-acetylmuramyl tripeptide synthase